MPVAGHGGRLGCLHLASSLLCVIAMLAIAVPVRCTTAVRVGAYHNPPKIAIDPQSGEVSGLYPSLIEYVAAEENWAIEYVAGTWTECLDRLARGDIDLMVDVALTESRQEIYAFNAETVLVNWGTVYTKPDLSILSLPELDGLRIAVMRGSTHTEDPGAIKDLVQQFGIAAEFVELGNYSEVFGALRSGTADAGVVNRIFGLTFEAEYGVNRTPIVFNPSELRFALPPNSPLTPILVTSIDNWLVRLKADPTSHYYQMLEEHLFSIPSQETVFRWPSWMLPTLLSAGVLILGLLISVLVIRREVRERRRAEHAHAKSEERFELAMRGATDGLWDWNLDTGRVYYSPRWCYMLGYKVDQLDPTIDTFRELVHPDDLERVLQAEQRLLSADSDRYQAEFRMLHRDGIYITVLSRAFVERDTSGHPVRIVGTHVDISERKFAEENLRESEAYLRAIIENMPVDFFAIDRNRYYTMQSPTSIQAIGSVIGQRSNEIDVDESLKTAWEDELTRVLGGEAIQHEYDIPTRSGNTRTYLSNMSPVRVQGEIIAAIGTSLDITERKRASTELREAKDRAEAADRLKSAFLATMSHELRTPLNSIIGFTGILLQELPGAINDEQRKQLGMVQTSARHLLALINDVLDISKIEAGQLEVTLEPFDVPELVQEVVCATQPLADVKALQLDVDVAERVGTMDSDRRRVSQILTNLLSNAIKFTEEGRVAISVTSDELEISFAVADTGIGIGSEDLEKLFVPFQQVDSGLTRKYEGTGLGLSICRRLAEKLEGIIEVESTPGQGSTFTVTLPLHCRGGTDHEDPSG